MSKYEKLQTFLALLPGRSWTAAFAEIEQLLGFALPPSALKHQAWWANDSANHSHALSWLSAGWRTSTVSLESRSVTFVKGSSETDSKALNKALTGKTIALISCGKRKAHQPKPAKDLYLSPRFKYARALAEGQAWNWYVLSALHGLVAPDQTITPYDHSLVGASRSDRRSWSNEVLLQLNRTLQPHSHVVLLAGRNYTEFLIEPLRQMGHVVDEPLAGLNRGEQLSKLRMLASEVHRLLPNSPMSGAP